MPSYFRTPKPRALQATVAAFDYLPASQVIQVVERYVRELWVEELRKNPRIVLLAGLEVGGPSAPWDYGTADGRGRGLYLQSVDRYRAQALLGDEDAKWEVYRDSRNDYNRVRRVR